MSLEDLENISGGSVAEDEFNRLPSYTKDAIRKSLQDQGFPVPEFMLH